MRKKIQHLLAFGIAGTVNAIVTELHARDAVKVQYVKSDPDPLAEVHQAMYVFVAVPRWVPSGRLRYYAAMHAVICHATQLLMVDTAMEWLGEVDRDRQFIYYVGYIRAAEYGWDTELHYVPEEWAS